MSASFPLPIADLESCGFRPDVIERLTGLIASHIAEGFYPGCEIAIARHGKLAFEWRCGEAVVGQKKAGPETLWLVYSNTKPLIACVLWILAERGALRFADKVADHLPGFARHGKGNVTILQMMTHRGGFPGAVVPDSLWTDHARMREAVCDFTLEWTPGTRCLYHPSAAHWTAAAIIETITGQDYRTILRDLVLEPLGLADEIFLGVPEEIDSRAAFMYEVHEGAVRPDSRASSREFRAAGIPGGGAFAKARAMAAFYQMLLNGGTLNGVNLVSPRMLAYAVRDWTPGMIDGESFVQRGIGPYLRGDREPAHTFGSIAPPQTFGHGGVGSSVTWGDPVSGVSFSYLSNCRRDEPWHGRRMDLCSTMVHAAIL